MAPYLVKLDTFEITDMPRLKCSWGKFISRAPILVTFSLL